MIRAVLRRLGRNKTIWKRLPPDLGGGRVCCSPEALLSVWKPGWQSKQALVLFDWARRYVRPGMHVWDVGAHQGLFAFAAAAVCGSKGEVVAFEPDPYLVNLMERSIATGSHRGAPVRVLPVAVSDKHAVATFLIAATDRTLNHLATAQGNPRTGGSRASRLVMVATMDWLSEELVPPDLVKIDVEGAEGATLGASLALLKQHRPALIVEVAGENIGTVGDILREADYLMFDVADPRKGPLTSPAWNTLAVPRECKSEYL
ncbi:MAG: FkbM family methyltransferase [Thiocapsa sp.]|uniref:FkbM family methyltransferase n=1 Tax=Thiocapsa sp. TaxID=2024551 RepID=UPI001BCCED83|nr:FkbM family methyltransferase [Thiocapsa sp.]QVL50085.1 MAG: FkbM family methyltransferase [Thiocapsa sp.]